MMVEFRGADQPVGVTIGPIMVVTPNEQRLAPAVWTDLACAMVAADSGRSALADAMVASIERRLGVNEAHHRALVIGSDEWRRLNSEKKRRRILAEHQRAASLQSRTVDPGPSEMVGEKLRVAAEHRATAATLKARDAAAKSRGNRAAINQHLTAAAALEHDAQMIRDREVNDRWLSNATKETLDLARLRNEDVDQETIELMTYPTDEYGARLRHKTGSRRGQVVEHTDRVTRAVIRSRGGGLEYALEKGHLDGGPGSPKPDGLFRTGDRYREAYEIDEGQTSNSGGGAGGFGPKGPQIRLVEAGEILKIMRSKLSPRERKVLDLVCGQGMRLREVATRMKAGFPATTRALRNGLRTAAEQVKAASERGEIGVAGERVEAAHRELQKYRL